MSGHSKWATIKHKKGAADAKRGKIFSKMAKEIMVCAKQGGGNPEDNITLRSLVQKAKGVNMPNDNIERAIKKGTGEGGVVNFEEIVYEAYAGGGVAIVVEVLTDNKNRAAAEIRHIFNKNNSSFATQGSVTRNFERKGQILVEATSVDEDALMDLVLEAGADDMTSDEGQFEIVTEPGSFADVSEALEKAEIAVISGEVTLLPLVTVPVADKTVASPVLRFVAALEDNDDVQNVYTNMDMTDEVMDALADEE